MAQNLGQSGDALFTDADLEVLARVVTRRSFRRGDVLFRQESKSSGVWILQDGSVVLSSSSGRRRSALAIFGERQCVGEDGKFPFSQDVCAALLGAARPSVNQVLRRFESEGLVRLSYGRIEVADMKQIVRIAD